MSYQFDVAGVARLEAYFAQFGSFLKDKRKRESFAMYAFGILGEGERKSAEPIAARACGDEGEAQHTHDKLLHFLTRASWDDHVVRRVAARYALAALSARRGGDDLGHRRYGIPQAGEVFGRRAEAIHGLGEQDCQLSGRRRSQCRDPHRTPAHLRETVRLLGLDYAVGMHAPTKVWCLDKSERRRGEAIGAQELRLAPGRRAFRRVTWREGTGGKLSSRFCFRRVQVACDDGLEPAAPEAVWLMMGSKCAGAPGHPTVRPPNSLPEVPPASNAGGGPSNSLSRRAAQPRNAPNEAHRLAWRGASVLGTLVVR